MVNNYWATFDEGGIYHIYNRSINKELLFINQENYFYFLNSSKKHLSPYFDFHAYCLMPNHFHFLAKVKRINKKVLDTIGIEKTRKSIAFLNKEINYHSFLESQFKRFLSSYALSFNKMYNRKGSLFQKRFKRILIANISKYLHTLIYIHHNPIHHYLADDFGKWKFDSFNAYLNNSASHIITEEVLENYYSSDPIKALELFLQQHEDYKKAYKHLL